MCDEKNESQHNRFRPFRESGNEESSLYIVYKAMTAKYDPTRALEFVKEFCLTSTSIDNQKKSLEFLYMSNFFPALDQMIEKNKQSNIVENQQWAQLFAILMRRRRETVDHYEILKQVQKMKPVSEYVEIYQHFTTIYCYHELRQSGKAANHLDRINELMHNLEDPLIITFMQERLEDYYFFYHFQRNELILCRMYGFRLLKKPYNLYKNCLVHRNIALTYLWENYDQCMYHVHEALKIARKHGYTLLEKGIMNHNVPFIAAVHEKYEGITTTDPIEEAHLNIAKGNIKEAVKVLSNIEHPSHYQEYYLGKALGDLTLLMKSYSRFIQKGDYFGAKLPFMELQKLRENSSDDEQKMNTE